MEDRIQTAGLDDIQSAQAANGNLELAQQLLKIRELGNATPEPNPQDIEDGTIPDARMAMKAYELFQRFESYKPRIATILFRGRANTNKRRVLEALNTVDSVGTNDELDELETLLDNFMANPVEMDGNQDTTMVEVFRGMVDEVESYQPRIDTARERLRREATSGADRGAGSSPGIHAPVTLL